MKIQKGAYRRIWRARTAPIRRQRQISTVRIVEPIHRTLGFDRYSFNVGADLEAARLMLASAKPLQDAASEIGESLPA